MLPMMDFKWFCFNNEKNCVAVSFDAITSATRTPLIYHSFASLCKPILVIAVAVSLMTLIYKDSTKLVIDAATALPTESPSNTSEALHKALETLSAKSIDPEESLWLLEKLVCRRFEIQSIIYLWRCRTRKNSFAKLDRTRITRRKQCNVYFCREIYVSFY